AGSRSMARQAFKSPIRRGRTRSRCVSKLGSMAKNPATAAFHPGMLTLKPQADSPPGSGLSLRKIRPISRGHERARQLMNPSRQDRHVPAPAADELAILRELEKKVLWLASWTIHHANHLRESSDGLKV